MPVLDGLEKASNVWMISFCFQKCETKLEACLIHGNEQHQVTYCTCLTEGMHGVFLTLISLQNCTIGLQKASLLPVKVDFKEGDPSDKELDELAGKIGDVWEQLAARLGINRNVVSGIAANDKDKPMKMLVRWINTTKSDNPYGELYDALCHERVGLDKLAKEFCCKKPA